ncbi:hypothetical protein PM082_012215 [Marasmius tenuissimus]|nr:hypothetical protein PM082_012215 [Marasmius tenuissimus]
MNPDIGTPFARVLNTNYVPSNEELGTLRDLVQEPEEQIRKLDEEISYLQARRQALREFVIHHRALLSPHRRLPTEIWASIFVKCLPDNELGLCSRSTQDAPLLLTTICRQWREIALSTPELWNSIHIYLPIPSGFPYGGEVTDDAFSSFLLERREGFKVWLDRSGSLPITISLASHSNVAVYQLTPGQSWPGFSFATSRIFRAGFTELLAQYSHRWKTVVLGTALGRSLDLAPFETLTTNDLSSLENFYSYGVIGHIFPGPDEHDSTTTTSPLVRILIYAHSLRRLRVSSECISAHTLSLPLPWHGLTELSISCPSEGSLDPATILRTLANQCLSLITFRLDVRSSTTGQNTLAPAVEWSSLQVLRISFDCPPFGIGFDGNQVAHTPLVIGAFESVTLPSLVRLFIDFEDPYYPHNLPDLDDTSLDVGTLPFEDLMQRSECRLTHFELSHLRQVGIKPLSRVLQSLDSLVSLNLGRTSRKSVASYDGWVAPYDNEFIVQRRWLERLFQELLSTSVEDRSETPEFILCPKLKEFRIGVCSLDGSDVLLDFAIKRPNLGLLRVDYGSVLPEDVRRIMDSEKIKEGMRTLREEQGVVVDWKWKEKKRRPLIDRSDSTEDMPHGEDSWW